jgi:hypothetical protein
MPMKPLKLESGTAEIRKNGTVVGLTDKVYTLDDSDEILFEDVLVRGDLSGPLKYNGRKIEIVGVDTIVGLELGPDGARGPVWKRVRARILE